MFTQSMFTQMKPFSEFNYWFIPEGNKLYSIIDKNEGAIGIINSDTEEITGLDETKYNQMCIQTDWNAYKLHRPEYYVGVYNINTDIIDPEEAIDIYEKLLIGVAFVRSYRNQLDPDTSFSKIYRTLEWLRSGDFYTAPASTIYHESIPSGLLYHTLKVVNKIQQLKSVESFRSVRIEDAVLVALVHDWCKIGLYEMYMKNQKNEQTGQWEKVPAYKRKDSLLPMGHGAASMWQASKCFKLSTNEALAIRWHQGRWNVCEAEVNEFQQANENYPLVHMIQFADQLAITNY